MDYQKWIKEIEESNEKIKNNFADLLETCENMKEIVEAFDMNQIFGRKEVKKKLGYGDYKAGKAIEVMQVLNIVIPVEGKGKGKYILKEM